MNDLIKTTDWDADIRNLRHSITSYLEYYQKIIIAGYSDNNNDVDLAKYILHTKAFNAFSAARQLCESGLHIESYNSIRLALENAWLALLMEERATLALEWLSMVAPEKSIAEIAKRYRKKIGNPSWVRRQLSRSEEDKERRDKLYSVLSTKSHANVASTFFMCCELNGREWLQFYGPGGIDDKKHKQKNLQAIKFCFGFVLKELVEKRGLDNSINWTYDEMEIVNIAGIADIDDNGKMHVIPDKVNQKYQEMMITYRTSRKNIR